MSSNTTLRLHESAWAEAVSLATTGSLFPGSSLHGEDHWRAVATQGLRLASAARLGAEGRAAAALFGLFHDCRRENDGWDPEHGPRGAAAFHDTPCLQSLPRDFRNRLVQSMIHHDGGQTSADPIVGLGWDADRSVLTRVGITPAWEFFSVVSETDFEAFVDAGFDATRTPLSWSEIHAAAFA